MLSYLRKRWNYLLAKLNLRHEETADPKVQLEQAISEAKDQHRRIQDVDWDEDVADREAMLSRVILPDKAEHDSHAEPDLPLRDGILEEPVAQITISEPVGEFRNYLLRKLNKRVKIFTYDRETDN